MTTFTNQLVARAWNSQQPHALVMAVVIAVALVPATAVLGPVPSGALRSGPEEFVTVPATNGPEMPQSLGYLEYDWSAAEGGVPGFALLSDNSN
jgi:hypothetical protein